MRVMPTASTVDILFKNSGGINPPAWQKLDKDSGYLNTTLQIAPRQSLLNVNTQMATLLVPKFANRLAKPIRHGEA
jgi:hypothetical protein